ncbi:MAG: N-6 DNA methylase [Acidobacteria bacterium]|nr:N-6 DNA methylase [Acidobacteriota bacterium]
MMAGVRGRLITATFAQALLPSLPGAGPPPPAVIRTLDAWSDRREASVGPASSVRAICDAVVVPLLAILGFDTGRHLDRDASVVLDAVAPRGGSLPIVVVGWDEPLDRVWRSAVLDGIRADARWCGSCNGTAFRIADAHRTWARLYLEFDLTLLTSEPAALALFWSVARAETLAARPPLLDRAVELSARHGVGVCRALGNGVLDALRLLLDALVRRAGHRPPQAAFDAALIVLYRVLFLLFAEARGLVPMWHPIYRDRYSIETIVSALLARRRYRGIWQAVRAISGLVSSGCTAGELKVTAFNGRLFSPEGTATFDRGRIDDAVMGRAIMAVSTTPDGGGAHTRIAYRDLDVEQLGAVYEKVLEWEPVAAPPPESPGGAQGPPVLLRTRDARKSSGTFYTPRPVTACVIHQTLAPLVRDRAAEDILRLRLLDPAMGSGAFLVGACRYLAEAAEDALVREGTWHRGDITAMDRVALRREIAQRCLFGVDLNPMAVQLARLSLWLATLASDKPLTFLDHRLVAGDSLVGAAPDDLRRPGRGRRARGRKEPLPLFDGSDLRATIEHAVRTRTRIASDPDDSAARVRAKERTLAALHARESPLGRWGRTLDLWCATWFWEQGAPPERGAFGALCDGLLHGRSTLPERVAAPLLEHADVLAARWRFLHWPLAFPEVFADSEDPGPTGFDAVIGNPPWDMVRGDSGDGGVRAGHRQRAHRLSAFVRESGVYAVETRSHINEYQLFVERALQLVRAGGRIGLVLPSGIVSDAGAAPLRRHLFDRAAVDTVTGLDNRAGIFPIHRSVRFVLLTATAGHATQEIACRFGLTRVEDLEALEGPSASLRVSRRLLARVSGDDDLAIPEIATFDDLRIVEGISARHPWLGASGGWHVRFGRELNASDDRGLLVPLDGNPAARPVAEGKHIEPFRVSLDRCRCQLSADSLKSFPRRARLAYRDVASATNRLTLIAAMLPPRAVSTHTLFCLKTPLPLDAQHVLCALLNSFVANYLIRLRVHTHVTASLVSRLPAPLVEATDPAFDRLARLARALSHANGATELLPEYAALQALVARLYGVTEKDFRHILGTFPLVPREVRSAALSAFSDL